MNHALIIKTTNRVALYATVALFYWVIAYLTIIIFDLKIFRGHMTETFFLSILGIFAILGASIVMNVMSNLTKISEAIASKGAAPQSVPSPSKARIFLGVASIPVIVCLLFAGNALSERKKKALLVSAAEAMVSTNQKELGSLAAYEFSNSYIEEAGKILSVIEKIDKYFPEAKVIVPDMIGDKRVFLAFDGRNYDFSKKAAERQNFIYTSSKEDRAYLEGAFSKGNTEMRFLASGGNYELYVPVKIGGRIIVIYFSDYQHYGKLGS